MTSWYGNSYLFEVLRFERLRFSLADLFYSCLIQCIRLRLVKNAHPLDGVEPLFYLIGKPLLILRGELSKVMQERLESIIKHAPVLSPESVVPAPIGCG